MARWQARRCAPVHIVEHSWMILGWFPITAKIIFCRSKVWEKSINVDISLDNPPLLCPSGVLLYTMLWHRRVAVHESHSLDCTRSHEQRLQTWGCVKKSGVDGFASSFAWISRVDEEPRNGHCIIKPGTNNNRDASLSMFRKVCKNVCLWMEMIRNDGPHQILRN